MFAFIEQLPAYLVFSTIVLVFIPSLITIYLRLTLHKHLVFLEARVRRLINRGERGSQPEIINELEKRFKEASSDIERVNTVALIDQVYSREKVGLMTCEQIDYICRTLPSLLLAFGVLGTFLGITINLASLSQTISQTDISDVNSLMQEIQEPLKSMGIAFTTSLVGILFSALLTVVNLFKNTSVAKYKLISAIEDYLDNIYLPKVQGNNRLDKAVDRLVFEFKDFLGRFGTTVRQAVESSLGEKIQQIVDVNVQANQLARQVYNGFQESAGTISSSVNEFENAVAVMVTNVEKYQQSAQIFENSQFPQKLSNATAQLEHIQNNFSKSAMNLGSASQSIEIAVIEMQNSSKKVVNLSEEVRTLNQNSIQALELHQNNQRSLSEIVPQLQQGGKSFNSVVKIIERIQEQVLDETISLSQIQSKFNTSVESLNKCMHQVNSGVDSLGDRLVKGIKIQTDINKNQVQSIVDNIQQCINHLNDTKHESYKLTRIFEKRLTKDTKDPDFELVNALHKI